MLTDPCSLYRPAAVQCNQAIDLEAAMSAHYRWIAALLAISAVTACATTVPSGARPATQPAHVTGTRIAPPVAPDGSQPQTAAPTQVVTQNDIQTTGHDNLASALRELVPALH
jgi:hypothetical protein